jgi:hypothetical protein
MSTATCPDMSNLFQKVYTQSQQILNFRELLLVNFLSQSESLHAQRNHPTHALSVICCSHMEWMIVIYAYSDKCHSLYWLRADSQKLSYNGKVNKIYQYLYSSRENCVCVCVCVCVRALACMTHLCQNCTMGYPEHRYVMQSMLHWDIPSIRVKGLMLIFFKYLFLTKMLTTWSKHDPDKLTCVHSISIKIKVTPVFLHLSKI